MTRFASALSRARRSLGNHLARLRHSFDALAEQVREAIARAIGRTVAEAVSEAVHAVLSESDGMPALLPAPSRSSNRPQASWDEPDERRWPDDRQDLYESDRYAEDDGLTDEDPDDELPEPTPRPNPVRRALAVGCRAAAYWLDRHHDRFSLAAAIGVGVIAGVAVLITGPSLASASGVAASAFGLLALVDAIRSGTALLTS